MIAATAATLAGAFAAVGAFAAAGALAAVPAASAAAGPTWPSGAFAGYGGTGLARFATWRGAPAATATDYIGSDNWGQIEDPAWAISQWAATKGVTPDLSVALWPSSGGSLADAATGAYNAHFVALAQNLVAAGLGSVGIRLGWEFNGGWYPWSVSTPGQAADYAAAWRQIVTAMRSVPGAQFTFDWCPNLQATGLDPSLSYPGDAYVSEIGMDVYDWNESALSESPQQRWSDIVDKGYGLAWQASFAAAHGKPIAFPEWGLVSYLPKPLIAGGDDPLFVENMFSWFSTHNVAFENYFDADNQALGDDYGITTGSGRFPRATAVYQKLYAGQMTPFPAITATPSTTNTRATTSSRPTTRASARRAGRRHARHSRHARHRGSHRRHRGSHRRHRGSHRRHQN